MSRKPTSIRTAPAGARARAPRAQAPGTLQLCLFDDITKWSVRALVEQLAAVPPDTPVVLRINCDGGEVTQGFALANALRAHPGRKVGIVEGVCASAATFPACACDELQMYAESLFMVHSPWGGRDGGAQELETQAGVLRKMAALMVSMYQRKTGADEETVRQWLAGDTWLEPQEAKEAGFCDVILGVALPPAARAKVRRFKALFRPGGAPSPGAHPRKKQRNPMPLPENLRSKLAKHGLADDDSNMQSALAAYLAESEDGPEARRDMAKAVAAAGDEPEASDDDPEDDETSTGDGTPKNLRTDAHADPAIRKLIASLQSKVTQQDKTIGQLTQDRDQRAEKDFYAAAEKYTSRKDAEEYLQATGGDHGRALALIKKLPVKNSAYKRFFAGGAPVDGTPAPAAQSVEATKVVRTGNREVHLHGFGLAQVARKIAADRKLSLEAAYKAAIRERPDLAASGQ